MPDTAPAVPAPATTAPPPSPVAPAPAPARVNEDEKRAREAALKLRQEQQAWASQKAQEAKAMEAAKAKLEQERAAFEQAKQVGLRDPMALFRAANVPPDQIPAKLTEWQMQAMRGGELGADPSAPVSALEARFKQMEARLDQQAQQNEARAAELAAERAQIQQQVWYGNLERDVTSNPDCRLTKIPFLRVALDQELQQYEQESRLDYRPVFGAKAKDVEARLAAELAGVGYHRVEGMTVYNADGTVKGTIGVPEAAPAAASEGAPAPVLGTPPAIAGLPPGFVAPPPGSIPLTRNVADIVSGVSRPGPAMPPTHQVRTLDGTEGAAPGAGSHVFGTVRKADAMDVTERLRQITAAQNNAQGGKPVGM